MKSIRFYSAHLFRNKICITMNAYSSLFDAELRHFCCCAANFLFKWGCCEVVFMCVYTKGFLAIRKSLFLWLWWEFVENSRAPATWRKIVCHFVMDYLNKSQYFRCSRFKSSRLRVLSFEFIIIQSRALVCLPPTRTEWRKWKIHQQNEVIGTLLGRKYGVKERMAAIVFFLSI